MRIDFIKRTDKLFDKVMQDSTEVGPRVGANYLLTADGRNTVRARSWGRVHDAVSLGSGTSAGSVSLGFRDVYDLDLNGSFETTFVTPPVTTLFANRFVDLENFHQPRIDEWILGYRRQLPGRTTVDASVVRREYRDRNGFIDINPIYQNGRFVGYRDETLNDLLQITSNRFNWPAYTGLEFQVTKETSWLQILGSYTRAFQSFDGTLADQ